MTFRTWCPSRSEIARWLQTATAARYDTRRSRDLSGGWSQHEEGCSNPTVIQVVKDDKSALRANLSPDQQALLDARLGRPRGSGNHEPPGKADKDCSAQVIPLQTKGSRTPFFCIHAAGGGVLCYLNLARHFRADQPFYGVAGPGPDCTAQPHYRIEEMAEHYVESIRKIQPQGPFYLGGWSMGGIIAYEMARQFLLVHERVALVAFLDSWVPVRGHTKTEESRTLDSLPDTLVHVFGRPLPVSADSLRELGPDERLEYILEKAIEAHVVPPNFGTARIQRLIEIFETNVKALEAYEPPIDSLPRDTRVVSFLARERAVRGRDSYRSAGDLIPGVATQTVPGNHLSMLYEPHVAVVARQLTKCLREVQESAGR